MHNFFFEFVFSSCNFVTLFKSTLMLSMLLEQGPPFFSSSSSLFLFLRQRHFHRFVVIMLLFMMIMYEHYEMMMRMMRIIILRRVSWEKSCKHFCVTLPYVTPLCVLGMLYPHELIHKHLNTSKNQECLFVYAHVIHNIYLVHFFYIALVAQKSYVT